MRALWQWRKQSNSELHPGEVAVLVAVQVGLGVEALGAEGAVEGLLARVAPHVALQVALLVEALGAQLALVGLLARVALHVPCQVHLLVEGHATHAAAELPVHRPTCPASLSPRTLPRNGYISVIVG